MVRAEIAPDEAEDAGGLDARQGRPRSMAPFLPEQIKGFYGSSVLMMGKNSRQLRRGEAADEFFLFTDRKVLDSQSHRGRCGRRQRTARSPYRRTHTRRIRFGGIPLRPEPGQDGKNQDRGIAPDAPALGLGKVLQKCSARPRPLHPSRNHSHVCWLTTALFGDLSLQLFLDKHNDAKVYVRPVPGCQIVDQ